MTLTNEQILEVADRPSKRGTKSTLVVLWAEVGGSYGDLAPALRQWKAARREAKLAGQRQTLDRLLPRVHHQC